jgi:hypothetical protein
VLCWLPIWWLSMQVLGLALPYTLPEEILCSPGADPWPEAAEESGTLRAGCPRGAQGLRASCRWGRPSPGGVGGGEYSSGVPMFAVVPGMRLAWLGVLYVVGQKDAQQNPLRLNCSWLQPHPQRVIPLCTVAGTGGMGLMVDTDVPGKEELHIPILAGFDADTPAAAEIHLNQGHAAYLGCGRAAWVDLIEPAKQMITTVTRWSAPVSPTGLLLSDLNARCVYQRPPGSLPGLGGPRPCGGRSRGALPTCGQ